MFGNERGRGRGEAKCGGDWKNAFWGMVKICGGRTGASIEGLEWNEREQSKARIFQLAKSMDRQK